MADLSQFRALLSEHDDATIAGMAGCSPEDVATFRAALAAPSTNFANALAAPAVPKEDKKKAEKKAAEPAPPPPPRSVASYVAELSLDEATALYEALHARLHPAPAEQPAPPSVRSLGNLDVTGVDGRLLRMRLRDVYTGELAAHLWTHHRKAVEAYPVRR